MSAVSHQPDTGDELEKMLRYVAYHGTTLTTETMIARAKAAIMQLIAKEKEKAVAEAKVDEARMAFEVATNHNMDSGHQVALILGARYKTLRSAQEGK